MYYEPRPGLPLVYGSRRDEIALELSLFDLDPAGNPFFVVSTDDGPAAISMPPDLLQWPPTIINGVPIHTLSPLALVQIRAGASATGAFGTPRPMALVRPNWSKPSSRTSTPRSSRPQSRYSAACSSACVGERARP